MKKKENRKNKLGKRQENWLQKMLMIYLIDLTMNICNAIQRVKNDNRKFSWVSWGDEGGWRATTALASPLLAKCLLIFLIVSAGQCWQGFLWPGQSDPNTNSIPYPQPEGVGWGRAGVVKRKSFASLGRVNYAKRLSICVWFVLAGQGAKGLTGMPWSPAINCALSPVSVRAA